MPADFLDDRSKIDVRLNALKGYLQSKQQQTDQERNNLGNNFQDPQQTASFLLSSKGNNPAKQVGNVNSFDQLVDLLSSSMGDTASGVAGGAQSSYLRGPALQALNTVAKKINDVVRDEMLHGMHISTTLGCGVDAVISNSTISLSPDEFDALGLLRIDPSSKTGGALYEPTSQSEVAMNNLLYSVFNGATQSFVSKSGNSLFTLAWDAENGVYNISNLLINNVYNFVTEYFASIKIFNIKTLYALLTTLLSGTITTENAQTLTKNVSTLNRLISAIMGRCADEPTAGNLTTDNTKEFDETPVDIQDLFSFDEVEGLNTELEELRIKQVLKFADCGSLEVPVDANRLQEFFEDFDRNQDNPQHLDNMLNDLAGNVYQQTGGSIPMETLKISLNKNFIKNLPKALLGLIMTPKVLFPFVMLRKAFGGVATPVNNLLKMIYSIIFRILRRIFEQFLIEFFKIIKKELLRLINTIVADTISELGSKQTAIIKSLLAVLRKLISADSDVATCGGLFKRILDLLTTSVSLPFSVPTPLLLAAESRSGFSNIRAFINVVEELDKVGIPTGDLYGQPNKHVLQHLAHIRGVEKERSENGVVKATILAGSVLTPAGPGIIPPGTVQVIGING